MKFSDIPKYCISLKRSTERRALVMEEFKKAGIRDVWFFEAVDGSKLVLPELSVKPKENHSYGQLGCMLSHLEVMKQARAKGEKIICVFEDDLIVCNDFQKRISYIEGLRGFSFDMLLLGGFIDNPKNKMSTMLNHIFHIKKMNGTYGYIINDKAMDFYIRNATYNYGSDEFFTTFIYPKFACFAFLPFLVAPRPCVSEISGAFCEHTGHVDYQQKAIEDISAPYGGYVAGEWEKSIHKSDMDREQWIKNTNG